MKIQSASFNHGEVMNDTLVFGTAVTSLTEPAFTTGGNRNPQLSWSDAPAEAQSFVLICVDPDVPSIGDHINQVGHSLPTDMPRVDFYHWVLIDVPADCHELAEGAFSDGVTARGKSQDTALLGREGFNDYRGWFAGDADMSGDWHGYDGPCPPFNDLLEHRYFFRLFALDVATLDVPADFSASDVLRAMQGHVLAETAMYGRYSRNPAEGVVTHQLG